MSDVAPADVRQPERRRSRGHTRARVIAVVLVVVLAGSTGVARARQAQARDRLVDVASTVAKRLTTVHERVAAALSKAADDPNLDAELRVAAAEERGVVARLAVPRRAPKLEDAAASVRAAVEDNARFLEVLDEFGNTPLVDRDDEGDDVKDSWDVAVASYRSLDRETGVRVANIDDVDAALDTYLTRRDQQADVARTEAEAASERDAALASLQEFYESVLDVIDRYATARADLEAQDNGKRVIEDSNDVSEVRSALETAAKTRTALAAELTALETPRDFSRSVAALAQVISKGAALLADATDAPQEAYSSCSYYSYYSTTTTIGCPATVGSTTSYRAFLAAAKEQSTAYETALNQFRAAYEAKVRTLYIG